MIFWWWGIPGFELRVLCLLGRCSTIRTTPQAKKLREFKVKAGQLTPPPCLTWAGVGLCRLSLGCKPNVGHQWEIILLMF
jgi:hypothetical protein